MVAKFTVASFNTNSVRARLPLIARWLQAKAPDVLCLQETKVKDDLFPRKEFEDLGYFAEFRGEGGYNGVATVAKTAPHNVIAGLRDGDEAEEPRIITVEIRGVPIVNTYLPQGTAPDSEKFQYKLEWFSRLKMFFEKNFDPQKPLLWVGDFNVAPEPLDVYDPEKLSGEVGFHPREREALKRIADWGFVDVFRLHNSEPGQYTFWDYRIRNAVKRGLGWRVDHIWATRPLAAKSTRAMIDLEPRLWERPSDHTFIMAEFDLNESAKRN